MTTGVKRNITITNDNKSRLSNEKIERMVWDAKRYKAEDDVHRNKVKLAPAVKKKIKDSVEKVFQWLDEVLLHPQQFEFEDMLKWLERICNPITIYAQQNDESYGYW
ncbi:heat shock cognate 70 kDa protein-like isoform X3 [Fagus crenata]